MKSYPSLQFGKALNFIPADPVTTGDDALLVNRVQLVVPHDELIPVAVPAFVPARNGETESPLAILNWNTCAFAGNDFIVFPA